MVGATGTSSIIPLLGTIEPSDFITNKSPLEFPTSVTFARSLL